MIFSSIAVADTATSASPASITNDPSIGTELWTTSLPSSVIVAFPAVPESQYLTATDFGFSIPANATITGIEVAVSKVTPVNAEPGTLFDLAVRIVKGGVIGSADRSDLTAWPNPAQTITHGGASDLWGKTWTPADINAGDFGFAIAVEHTGTLCEQAQVNTIQITVHFVPLDHYTRYKIGVAKTDLALTPIDQSLLAPWVVTLDDVMLSNSDDDDPENYEVKKAKELLLPAMKNDEPGPSQPDLHYMSYQITEGDETVGAAEPDGDYAKATKHIKRRWELTNQFGTINVESTKVSRLWVPTEKDLTTPPVSPAADATHWLCYQVKAAKEITDQTPGACSSDAGLFAKQPCQDDADCGGTAGQFTFCTKPKFRKDIQALFSDQFNDCELDKDGNTQFPSTTVEKKCLVTLKKPKELCSPVAKTAVEVPRITEAVINSSSPSMTSQSLLCYQASRATKVLSATTSSLVGIAVGEAIPGQAKPASQAIKVKEGSAIFTYPGNGFNLPQIVEKPKLDSFCVPTDVLTVTPLL
jgi:hypothetical protein